MSRRGRRRSGSRFGGAVLVASLGCLVGAGIALASMLGVVLPGATPAAPAILDAPPEPPPGGEVSQPTVDGRPAAAPVPPVDGQPLSVQIPSLGMVANVGSMSVPANGQVNPPTPGSGYWIRQYGLVGPMSDNTAYIAGHTFRSGRAVFNPILDIPRSATTVPDGAEVIVTAPEGSYRYTVTKTAVYDKVSIGDAAELWEKVPGRLALITCFQYNGGTSSTQNVVVYAQLDDDQPAPVVTAGVGAGGTGAGDAG